MSMTWEITRLDSDMTIRGGTFALVKGPEEVAQRILVTLRHFWYENWLNLQGGVPWYELILGSKDRATAGAILRKIILGVPGVVGIVQFAMSFSSRVLVLAVTVRVKNTSGASVVSLNVSLP